jgi:hypothetical protein
MPAPKKTLFLHAGMGKTGTTAIQETFWANRAALSRAGIAYPRTGAVAGAHHLVSPRLPPFIARQTGWTQLAPADWMPEVAALPQPRVFMSSELISSADASQITAFCAALEPVFDLRLCLYLRRQDDIIAASYAQAVKAGTQVRPIADVLGKRMDRFDYQDRITPWEQALGRDRLIILPYERGQFHQRDLIRDVLCRVLGLDDLPEGFVHDPGANPNARLSIAATEFKRLINAVMPDPGRSGRFNPALFACPPDPKGAHLISRDDRLRVLAHFADSNAHIARTYMGRPDGDLFHDHIDPAAPEAAPQPGTEALRSVAGTIAQHSPRLLRELAELAATDQTAPVAQKAALRLREVLDITPTASATPSATPSAPGAPRIATATRPRVIVHFGMHKTGSSSIQHTLWDSRDRLGAVRLLDFGRVNGSFAMTDFFRKDAGKGRDPAEFTAAVGVLGDLTGLISAEVISVFTPTQLARLLAALDAAGAESRFVGYVREPVGFYSSLFQQTLKTRAARLDDITTWSAEIRKGRPYFHWVDMLSDKVGADRVTAYPFARDLFPKGDVVRHFLGHVGLDPDRIAPIQSNESLSALAVKALYVWRNRLAPRDDATAHPTSAGDFIHRLRTIPGPRFRFAPNVEDRLRTLHPDYADWARDRLVWPAGHDPVPLPPPVPAAPGTAVFASEADLMTFTPDEVAVLSAWAGLRSPGALSEEARADHVAALMAATRDEPPLPKGAAGRPRDAATRAAPAQGTPTLATRIRVGVVARLPVARLAVARAVASLPALPGTARSPQELIVHFGPRKTGTSSIQETLFRNPGRLGRARYMAFDIPNSSLMVREAFLTPESHNRLVRTTMDLRFRLALTRVARAPRAIFSAETISDLDEPALARLATLLASRGARLTFLGYLRDPVSYSRSAMQERLKMRYFAALPFLPGANLTKHYHQIIDRLDAVAGRDNVRVFPFDRSLFPQGDVVRHFLDQAGIDPEGLTIHRVNDSLSLTAVKALHAYRRLRVQRDSDIGSDDTREDFVARLGTLAGPAFLLAPEIDARIAAANTHILDWSEARLGRRLALPVRTDDDGIRDEAGMLQFSDEELALIDALARTEGLPGLPAGSAGRAAEAVADILHALRLKVAGKTAGQTARQTAGQTGGG